MLSLLLTPQTPETQTYCRDCTALPWTPKLGRSLDKPLLEGGGEEESKTPTLLWV